MLSIVKRSSIYYFRIRIPSDVRKHFPAAEIMKSLHTRLYRQAKVLARSKLGELEKVFMAIRSGVLTDEVIKKVVTKYLDTCVANFDRGRLTDFSSFDHDANGGYETFEGWHKYLSETFMSSDKMYDEWLRIQQALIDARKKHLGRGKATEEPDITYLAEDIIAQLKLDVPKDSQEFRTLCTELLKASIKADSISLEHLKGNFETDYDVELKQRKNSKTLKELIELYQKEKAEGWVDAASTKAIHSRILHILGNIHLSEIDREMCVQFREDLKEYPLKNSDFVTPWRVLSKKKSARLSERTQNGTISELITLFNYANDNHLGIKGNPARNLLRSKEDCTPVKVREYYTEEELNRMVQVLAKTDRVKKPETFWIPLLALYTGARANEICMLRCDDIVQEGEGWFIHFRNIPAYHQRTKNDEDRRAPVHNHLLAVGFVEFVKQQQQAGQDRLFSNLKLKRDKWNVDYGKQYNRTFKMKFLQGYTEEQLSGKDLHTFRKTMISRFVKSGLVNDMLAFETLRSIVGHFEDNETNSIMKYLQSVKLTLQGYGGGFETNPATFLNQLDYGIDLSPIMPKGAQG